MTPDKAEIKLLVMKDLMFRAPLWALLILALCGSICFVTFWLLLKVVKPSIDKKMEKKDLKNHVNVDKNKIFINDDLARK